MNFMKQIGLLTTLTFSVLINPSASAQQMREQKMTVQELAARVEENNIQLKLGRAAVKTAEAQIGEVKNNRLPNISADMQAFYLSDATIFDKNFRKLQEVDLPNFGHQFNLGANQLLYAGGKVNKSIQLAELGKQLSETQLEDTDQGVKLSAAELFLNLYKLQNQKQILESNKRLAGERTKNAREFHKENMITKNEVLRAEVLERQLEQSILQVENSILITNKNLALFAGLDEDILIVPDVSNINHHIREQDEVFYRSMAFENNPKLKAGDTQVALAEKNLALTRADRLPVLAAFAGYNASRPQTSGVPAMDVYTNTYQAGLSLSYDLESIFKNPKKEAVDKMKIEQAELGREAVRQQIEAEVSAAYKNYHQAVEQQEVSALNEEAAEENYRITELKHKNQLVTYIEIIDASNIKLQAELQSLDDRTNIIINYIKLLRASGQL